LLPGSWRDRTGSSALSQGEAPARSPHHRARTDGAAMARKVGRSGSCRPGVPVCSGSKAPTLDSRQQSPRAIRATEQGGSGPRARSRGRTRASEAVRPAPQRTTTARAPGAVARAIASGWADGLRVGLWHDRRGRWRRGRDGRHRRGKPGCSGSCGPRGRARARVSARFSATPPAPLHPAVHRRIGPRRDERRARRSAEPASPSAFLRWTRSRSLCRSIPQASAAVLRSVPPDTIARASMSRAARAARPPPAALRKPAASNASRARARVITIPPVSDRTHPHPNRPGTSQSRQGTGALVSDDAGNRRQHWR
jgi:hypothetical protein